MGKYTPEDYAAMDIDEYRRKFPTETARFSDEQLWNAVAATDDDMTDVEWKSYFVTFGTASANS